MSPVSSKLKFEREDKELLHINQLCLNLKGKEKNFTGDNRKKRRDLEEKYKDNRREAPQLRNLVSYVGNKKVPFLSLYRYKEAFSYGLVDVILRNFPNKDITVFDPFCGMGTTIFTAAVNGISAYGIDKLPLCVFISNAIMDAVLSDKDEVQEEFFRLKGQLNSFKKAKIADDVKILNKVIPKENLSELKRWKTAISSIDNGRIRNILKLLFLSILIDSSYAKNSGQFLRIDRNKQIGKPTTLMEKKLKEFFESKEARLPKDNIDFFEKNEAFLGDSRDLSIDIPNPNVVITSPPYPNRYDYTRSYALELAFSFVDSNSELIELRHNLLRSHIESKIQSNYINKIHPAVSEVLKILESKDLNNNKIPDMLIGYFYDIETSIKELSFFLAKKAEMFIVVDNVRYEGEVIPIDLIIADIAESYGFKLKDLLITRYKGNSSQQMAKYGRVPVRESLIWLER